jgi:two-component system sensor histidine kinase RegB
VVFHFLIFLFWLVMRSLGLYLEKLHLLQASQRIQTERLDRLRAVGALAAGFSHEFASPLNAAKIRLQRLSSLKPLENLTLSQHEDIAEALSAVEDCEVVIRHMNASQLDTRDFQLKSVNIKDFLLDVVGAWQEEHPKAQVHVEPVLDILVSIPTLHFAQVILNLLDNAFEAAPQKKINISFSVDAKNYIFSVLDQGSGFDPSVLQRLGEPFVTTKAFGTGLGLYVSQLFVQFLGGEIKIQNQQPLGAQVTLCWPLRGNV